MLLLDLGLLSIKSVPKVQSKEIQAEIQSTAPLPDNINHPSEAPIDPVPPVRDITAKASGTEFYDEFHVSMSNIQLVLLTDDSEVSTIILMLVEF